MIDTAMALWNRKTRGTLVKLFATLLLICISISLLLVTVNAANIANWSLFLDGTTHQRDSVHAVKSRPTISSDDLTPTVSVVAITATPTYVTQPCPATPIAGVQQTSTSKTETTSLQDAQHTTTLPPHPLPVSISHLNVTPTPGEAPVATDTSGSTSTTIPPSTPVPTEVPIATPTESSTDAPVPAPHPTPTTHSTNRPVPILPPIMPVPGKPVAISYPITAPGIGITPSTPSATEISSIATSPATNADQQNSARLSGTASPNNGAVVNNGALKSSQASHCSNDR